MILQQSRIQNSNARSIEAETGVRLVPVAQWSTSLASR